MYKLIKNPGTRSIIQLVNTDTSASISIGMFNFKIKELLEETGEITFDTSKENYLSVVEPWQIVITDMKLKDRLAKLTLPMEKPKRNKAKAEVETEVEQPIVAKPLVNVLDIIYGRVK